MYDWSNLEYHWHLLANCTQQGVGKHAIIIIMPWYIRLGCRHSSSSVTWHKSCRAFIYPLKWLLTLLSSTHCNFRWKISAYPRIMEIPRQWPPPTHLHRHLQLLEEMQSQNRKEQKREKNQQVWWLFSLSTIWGGQECKVEDRLSSPKWYPPPLDPTPLLPYCFIQFRIEQFKCISGAYDLDINRYVQFCNSGSGQGHPTTRSATDPPLLKVPFCRTEAFKSSFFNRIVSLWNQLPPNTSGLLFLFLFLKLMRFFFLNQNLILILKPTVLTHGFCLAWTEFSKRLCDHSFCT